MTGWSSILRRRRSRSPTTLRSASKRNVEIRRLPIPVEYTVARKTYLESAKKPDGIYIPCGGWGSIRNIELLESDLDTTVVTWMNAMIWSSMRRGKVAGAIHGFGKLLASL